MCVVSGEWGAGVRGALTMVVEDCLGGAWVEDCLGGDGVGGARLVWGRHGASGVQRCVCKAGSRPV